MKVSIELWGQLRQAAGTSGFELDVADGASVSGILKQVAAQGNDRLVKILLNADGTYRSSNLMFVNGNQVQSDSIVADESKITLMSPIAGG